VKGITDSVTKTYSEIPQIEGKRVLGEHHAAQLRMMLTGATSAMGTGMRARVPGFVVAGKTGTAQKVDPNGRGYLKGTYISSFAGFVPAHNPRFVVYIAVDSPRKGYYGSEVAAPVFNRIAEYALRKSGIAPTVLADQDVIQRTTEKETDKILKNFNKEKFQTVPDLTGLSLRQVLDRVSGQDLNVEFKGKGQVATTSPPPGEPLTSERKLKIFLSE
jgi:cell division protein FtsI (penicillin-binding protein 3)